MSADPPAIDPDPDLDTAALQALRGDFLYFNVAGSGPTFPAAQDVAERFRRWLNEVGMFSHVGYDAYNEALAETRADLAAFVGDPGGASRIASPAVKRAAIPSAIDWPRGARPRTRVAASGSASTSATPYSAWIPSSGRCSASARPMRPCAIAAHSAMISAPRKLELGASARTPSQRPHRPTTTRYSTIVLASVACSAATRAP